MVQKKSSFGDKIGRNTQHQKENKKSFGYLNLPKDVKVLSIPEDTRKIELDFLPYEVTDAKHPDRDTQYEIAVPGSLWYRRPFKVHRNVGVDKETVVCLKSVGKKCPICEYQQKRMNEKADKEEIVALYGKPRSLYVVMPIGIKGYEEVPTIWDMSDKLFQETLNEELDSNEENRCFPDLETGKTLAITMKWKEFGKSKFPEVRSIIFTDRDDPYSEAILDDVPNLDEVLKILTYGEVEAKFFETDLEEDGGELKELAEEAPTRHKRASEEKEEAPRRKRVVEEDEAPRRQKPAPEPEEDEVDESPRTRRKMEEEKEEKPTSTRKTAEKEEEAPTRTKRSQKTEDDENPCPSGFRFGKDFEKYDECDDCPKWDPCFDASKKLK